MTVRCPICRNPVQLADPLSPFCSERCKTIDLGNWASGKYVVSRPADYEELARATGSPWPDEDDDGLGHGTSKLVH